MKIYVKFFEEKYSFNRNARSRKSTIGILLAKILGYNFIDTDILIQELEKKLLSEIIEENRIDNFIKIEE